MPQKCFKAPLKKRVPRKTIQKMTLSLSHKDSQFFWVDGGGGDSKGPQAVRRGMPSKESFDLKSSCLRRHLEVSSKGW